MAHRTKATTTDFRKNTITARITDSTKKKLLAIRAFHSNDRDNPISVSDALEIIIDQYHSLPNWPEADN